MTDSAATIDYAIRHHSVIKRFGRFPHRNQILSRATTLEEAVSNQVPRFKGSGESKDCGKRCCAQWGDRGSLYLTPILELLGLGRIGLWALLAARLECAVFLETFRIAEQAIAPKLLFEILQVGVAVIYAECGFSIAKLCLRSPLVYSATAIAI